MGGSDTEQDRLDLHGSAGFYRHVFVMERIGTAVRGSTVPDIFILRTALFPTVFYFSFADKRQKQNAGRHHAYGNHL